jgi:hypothetical protein
VSEPLVDEPVERAVDGLSQARGWRAVWSAIPASQPAAFPSVSAGSAGPLRQRLRRPFLPIPCRVGRRLGLEVVSIS